MSLWRPELVRLPAFAVGLGSQGLAWLTPGAPDHAIARTGTHADLAKALAGAPRGGPVNLIAASDVAVHWVQSPPSSVASFHELQLVAQARCAHLHGGQAEDWWITADWSASQPFVCAALPRAVIAPLQSLLGPRARWHTAWGLLCGMRHSPFPAQGWSALRSPERVTVWHCVAGRPTSMATLAVDPGATAAEAGQSALQHVRVESARSTQDRAGVLHWMDLVSPRGGASPAPDIEPVQWRLTMPGPARSEAEAALAVGSLLTGGAP